MTDWDDDEPLPSRARRSPLLAVLAAVVALAVAGTLVSVVVHRDPKPASTSSPAPEETTSTTAAKDRPTTLEGWVADISDFVAATRKLPFKTPVPVKLLDDAAFGKRVADDAVDDEAEIAKAQDVFVALGMLDPGVDLLTTVKSFLSAGVVGFYDPKTNELVVRGEKITPYVRTTLAHELTHALDDQQFELDRPDLDKADDERGSAFSALVEGNAVRVEEAYKKTLTPAERKAADDEEQRIGSDLDLSKVPRILPELIGFPYEFGPTLIDSLLKNGGEKSVDVAFGAPPETSEQVIDPKGWLDGVDDPVTVKPPKADGAVIDQGVIGFWGFYMLLEDALGANAAASAVKGWGGDWYVAWHDGSRTCVRADVVMDTVNDLRELTTGLERWAAKRPSATVTSSNGRTSFTSCA